MGWYNVDWGITNHKESPVCVKPTKHARRQWQAGHLQHSARFWERQRSTKWGNTYKILRSVQVCVCVSVCAVVGEGCGPPACGKHDLPTHLLWGNKGSEVSDSVDRQGRCLLKLASYTKPPSHFNRLDPQSKSLEAKKRIHSKAVIAVTGHVTPQCVNVNVYQNGGLPSTKLYVPTSAPSFMNGASSIASTSESSDISANVDNKLRNSLRITYSL